MGGTALPRPAEPQMESHKLSMLGVWFKYHRYPTPHFATL
jgi:hypothetical protein